MEFLSELRTQTRSNTLGSKLEKNVRKDEKKDGKMGGQPLLNWSIPKCRGFRLPICNNSRINSNKSSLFLHLLFSVMIFTQQKSPQMKEKKGKKIFGNHLEIGGLKEKKCWAGQLPFLWWGADIKRSSNFLRAQKAQKSFLDKKEMPGFIWGVNSPIFIGTENLGVP